MNELERYIIQEHAEDFRDGLLSRRELLRRVTLVTGSTAATLSALALVGCDLNQPQRAAATPNPPASTVSKVYATPPAKATTDGVTVRPDDPRIKAQIVAVRAGDGAALSGYLARPAQGNRFPGVLVVHENRGLVEHIRDVVRRLATAGFSAISIDLLSRQGGADALGERYPAAVSQRPPAAMVQDLQSALDYLKGQSFVSADRLAAIGFCFGGGMVWSVLAAGTALKAAVPFYGPAPSNLDGLASTRAAVFAVYAEQDSFVTPSASRVEDRLKQSGTTYKVMVYPGVQHAFHNDTNAARYAPAVSQQAWVATIDWLQQYLA